MSQLEHDRHRPVVHELDLHLRAEDTGRDRDAERSQLVAEPLVERLGDLRGRSAAEARPVPLRGVGDERELRDDERRPADVDDAPVEAALVVGEDPQPGDLPGELCGVLLRVVRSHAEQDAEAGPNLGGDISRDPYPSLGDPLADGPQSRSRIRARYWFDPGRSELASL